MASTDISFKLLLVTALVLVYYSYAVYLLSHIWGVLKAVARDLFHQSVEMSIIEQNKEDIGFNQSQEHTAFRVQLRLGDGSSTSGSDRLSPDGSSCDGRELVEFNPDTVLLRASDFCSAFPYHIIFDRDLRIRNCINGFNLTVRQWMLRSDFDDGKRLLWLNSPILE